MSVVSDTSPLINLAAIGKENVLSTLYGKVTIPSAVHEEIESLVAKWAEFPPVHTSNWIDTRKVTDSALVRALSVELHPGEAEAIALSAELQADLLLMDERIGRRIATRLGIQVIGLLGVLIEAKHEGLIEHLQPLLDQLQAKAGFWLGNGLYQRVLEEAGEQ